MIIGGFRYECGEAGNYVLVIDDDAVTRMTVSNLLKNINNDTIKPKRIDGSWELFSDQFKFKIATANDAKDAIVKGCENFDLVITDRNMGGDGKNGEDLIKFLRTNEGFKGKIIGMSADEAGQTSGAGAYPVMMKNPSGYNADAFFTKPLKKEEIRGILAEFFPEKVIRADIVDNRTPPQVMQHSHYVRRRSVDLEGGGLQNLRVARSVQRDEDGANITSKWSSMTSCAKCCNRVADALRYVMGRNNQDNGGGVGSERV